MVAPRSKQFCQHEGPHLGTANKENNCLRLDGRSSSDPLRPGIYHSNPNRKRGASAAAELNKLSVVFWIRRKSKLLHDRYGCVQRSTPAPVGAKITILCRIERSIIGGKGKQIESFHARADHRGARRGRGETAARWRGSGEEGGRGEREAWAQAWTELSDTSSHKHG